MSTATPEEEPRYCTLCGADTRGAYSAVWRDGVEDLSTIRCLPCQREIRLRQYEETGRITTSLMTENYLDTWKWLERGEGPEPKRCQLLLRGSLDRLADLVKKFDREAWLPTEDGGLHAQVDASEKSGMSADTDALKDFGVAKFMTWVSAGRVLIQVEDPTGARVTLITVEKHNDHKYLGGKPEDYPKHRMGIQGIDATEEEATLLLTNALAAFKAGSLTLHDDTDVGIGL